MLARMAAPACSLTASIATCAPSRMTDLTTLTAEERRRILEDYLDTELA